MSAEPLPLLLRHVCARARILACLLQAHYTEVLMRDMANVPLPSERIHSTTLSAEPKALVLARLAAEHPGAERYIFVEDKFSTLEKVGDYS